MKSRSNGYIVLWLVGSVAIDVAFILASASFPHSLWSRAFLKLICEGIWAGVCYVLSKKEEPEE